MQESFQQPVDGPNSVNDWTTDCARVIVSCRVDFAMLELTLSYRGLVGNQLIGPIPSTIGQLTSLTALYVVLWIHRQSSRCFLQVFEQ